MDFTKSRSRGNVSYTFSHTTPHQEGSDRGGSATETYNFRIVGDKISHEYSMDVDEPENFGIIQLDMTTKDDAISLIDEQREEMLKKIEGLDELKALLLEKGYEDMSEYDHGYSIDKSDDEDEFDEDED